MIGRTVVVAALAALVVAAPARATDFTVNSNLDDGNGVCTDGVCTLRDAVTQAGPADRVILPPQTYELSEGQLQFNGDSLVGTNARTTVIEGGNSQRVIYIASGSNAITGVDIRDGNAHGFDNPLRGMGGGILVSGQGMSLTISDSNLFDNSATQGGGIATRGGTLTVVRSTLTGNSAGGATDGGEGGGIYSEGTTTVLNSTISANTAANGEVASARGGGIQVNFGTFTVDSSTLDGNVADVGTALHRSGGTLTLSRTIVASVGPPLFLHCVGGPFAGALNVVSHATCGASPTDPQLGPLANNGGPTNTHALLAASPAIDGGGASCPADDQRGFARPAGEACDIGAFEAAASIADAELRLFTQVVNDSGGSLTAADFEIHVLRDGIDAPGSPAQGNSQGHDIHVSVGDYVVAASKSGYTTQVGGACAPSGAITLAANDFKTCTVTFNDVAQQQGGGGGTQPPPPPGGDEQLPQPKSGESVNVLPKSGTVKIKARGSNRFVELEKGQQIPVGSTVDTTKGRVTLIAAGGQQADFYDGIFRISQGKGAKPLTTLTLVEKLSCPKAGNAVAAAKKKKRRLWGDGSGKFQTRGKHSAATVVGTKWLVEDRCTSTLTRVVRGRVSVRDFVKKKTVIVRAGKKYVARARG